MAYEFYLDKTLLPVTPSQLNIKIRNQNKTINLINEGEVNIIKPAGLTEISFKALLPNEKYPFAQYKGGFKNIAHYLEQLEKLKTRADRNGIALPFQFVVSRTLPNGKVSFGTDMKVTLEDYKITEDAKNGLDVTVDISLKQYEPYEAKIVSLTQDDDGNYIAIVVNQRPAESAPQASTYTVVEGDTLWALSKRYLDNEKRFREIYRMNQALIDGANEGSEGSKYTLYAGQVLSIPG